MPIAAIWPDVVQRGFIENDHSVNGFRHVLDREARAGNQLLDARPVRFRHLDEELDHARRKAPVATNWLRETAEQQAEHGTLHSWVIAFGQRGLESVQQGRDDERLRTDNALHGLLAG